MEQKYRLIEKHIEFFGKKLYQPEALKDFGIVKKGDLGGYIENEKNLSQEGTCWVYDNARVSGNARVYGGIWEISPLQIQGTKYFVNMANKNTLRMGCQTHTLKKWLKHGEKIAEECDEVELWPEYERYLRLAVEMYQPELLEVAE